MQTVYAIIATIGFFIIAGTAGASDLDPFMPLSQITIQCGIGLTLLGFGVMRITATEEKGNR